MKIIKISGLILLITLLYFGLRKPIRKGYYDYLYRKLARNTIEWNKDYKLKWSDFNYEKPNDGTDYLFARVGISNRYEFTYNLGVEYESNTLFYPLDSYVSDTNDLFSLELVRARFNLCELYRRKLENKIKSLNFNKFPKSRKDSVDMNTKLFYELFESEWDELMSLPEKEIKNKLSLISEKLDKEK